MLLLTLWFLPKAFFLNLSSPLLCFQERLFRSHVTYPPRGIQWYRHNLSVPPPLQAELRGLLRVFTRQSVPLHNNINIQNTCLHGWIVCLHLQHTHTHCKSKGCNQDHFLYSCISKYYYCIWHIINSRGTFAAKMRLINIYTFSSN